ncbi:PEP/pyruvate-binding domain-containing protein [Paludibacter sp.]
MKKTGISRLYFRDTSFASLMKHRIYNVLLFASKYDVFVLEEDGRIDEQLFNEYTSLNLRYPPRFTLVSSEEEANKMLSERSFELIISMPTGDSINPFNWAKDVKKKYHEVPIVLLTPFSRAVSKRLANEDLAAIDYVFSWLGNPDLLLAIIKLLEDKMNVDEDIKSVNVQTILLMEDAIHFYSSILPRLYKFVFHQSRSFMTEALNDHEQMLRMRGRPKILLARNYEEGVAIYNKYKDQMLGVITDVYFQQDGVENDIAGVNLCKEIRKSDDKIPIIMLSTETSNEVFAEEVNATFVSKSSRKMLLELKEIIEEKFGFGDFLFINPITGELEAHVKDLRDLQHCILNLSDETLYYNVSRNNISRWLYSRALFPLARFVEVTNPANNEPEELLKLRKAIYDAILQYRKIKNRGVIAIFKSERFDQFSNFARIGDGSLGGKGRGLAFIDAMVKRNEQFDNFQNVQVLIPKTVVICTDLFSEFMEVNNLYTMALSDSDDQVILDNFLKAELPERLIEDVNAFLSVVNAPLAVRSSSLLEDSHYQPFAGIYSTYMVPSDINKQKMLEEVLEAIKAVYASVFYRDSKAYMTATKNLIDEEKMAIVLQEICGNQYENRFYPSFSGVARSLNFYPIGHEKPEDGTVNIAMGLGQYIVDGGNTLRFSPAYPHNVLQTSTIDFALRETQTFFYSLDLDNDADFVPQVDDGFNLHKINVQDAMKDGTLKYIASTYNHEDQILYSGLYEKGRKVITFANILEHEVFPLAEIIKEVLKVSHEEMGRPVEIEFAVNLDYSSEKAHSFYLLQIRPIVDSNEAIQEDIGAIPVENAVISSTSTLGHGITNDIFDIVYVKPEAFSASNNRLIMYDVEKVNKMLGDENKNYILVGPGRWGSSDEWLGIPVKWPHISNARLIVESSLSDYRIDPSQGTHFFQNLTSFGVSYFTINPHIKDGTYDLEFLNSQPAFFETKFLRHVRFSKPLITKVDGRKNLGVVLKPDSL